METRYEDFYGGATKTITWHGYTFAKTSEACPEQYDIYRDNHGLPPKKVAYMRLRFGRLTVQVPDHMGGVVFDEAISKDNLRGSFRNRQERYHYFDRVIAILNMGEIENLIK